MSSILLRNVRYTEGRSIHETMRYWNVIYMTCSRYGWGSLVALSWVQLTMVLSPSWRFWVFRIGLGTRQRARLSEKTALHRGTNGRVQWSMQLPYSFPTTLTDMQVGKSDIAVWKSSLVVHLQVVAKTRTYLDYVVCMPGRLFFDQDCNTQQSFCNFSDKQ